MQSSRGLNPKNVSGLFAWWRGDKDITLVSSQVSVWADQSGNGKDLSQGTAGYRPTVVSSSEANNQSAVQFDHTDDQLGVATAADWNFLHNGNGATVFVAVAVDSTNDTQALLRNVIAFQGYTLLRVASGGSTNFIVQVFGGGSAVVSLTGTDVAISAAHVVTTTYKEGSSPESVLRVDGSQQASGNSSGAPSSADADTTLKLSGLAQDNTIIPSSDAFLEILIYNRELAAAEIRAVERYLGVKYAIVVA